jgi:hypothetical protein
MVKARKTCGVSTQVSVWDYDSTFDDLIGFCPLKFSELAEAKGPKIAKTIKKDWFTLVDNAGAVCNPGAKLVVHAWPRAMLNAPASAM